MKSKVIILSLMLITRPLQATNGGSLNDALRLGNQVNVLTPLNPSIQNKTDDDSCLEKLKTILCMCCCCPCLALRACYEQATHN